MLFSWVIKDYDYTIYNELLNSLDISPVIIKLLAQRGINTYEQAQKYLYANLNDLSSPYKLSGIKEAVSRIKTAMDNQEKVVIYGDYDVDGVCSTVLLLECFNHLGFKVDYYIPDRFSEGYGLNKEAIKDLASQGYTLVISVDCGITSVEEVELAAKLGLDFIITDHHTPSDILPPAIAIINPKLDNDEEAMHLCGAGVAYKLVLALGEDSLTAEQLTAGLDLVTLATVADIVPLKGDNRILTKYGLKMLAETKRPGLKALLSTTGLDDKIISTWHIGFILAPRINAAGRMEAASLSIELLCSNNYEEALNMANQLGELNSLRKLVEEQILGEANQYVAANINLATENVLVVAGDNWHPGVIGIVASRLADKYHRPVIIISWEENEGRGSGRSAGDYDLFKALKSCAQHLTQFGGHKQAAGLSLSREKFAEFKTALLIYSQEVMEYIPHKQVFIDMEIAPEALNLKLVEELKLLEPFGEGNTAPNFICRQVVIADPSLVGKNKEHFKFRLMPGNINGIAFNKPEYANQPFKLLKQDMIFKLEENDFRGRQTVQLKVSNMKSSLVADKWHKHKEAKPEDISRTIIKELSQKRPIVIVYPTYRTLSKHFAALHNMINPKHINLLHGQLSIDERHQAEQNLAQGMAGIYLITQAYLDYFLTKTALPNNLHYILAMWSELVELPPTYNHIKVNHLFTQRNINIKIVRQDCKEMERAVVYSNRMATITSLKNQTDNVIVIAGENDYKKREALRQQFKDSEQGLFVVDGAFDTYVDNIEDVDSLFLLDMPFSYYETYLAMNQISSDEDVALNVLFVTTDMTSNKQYLTKLYPQAETIKQAWLYFIKQGQNSIRTDLTELNQGVARYLNKNPQDFSIHAVLMILVDLGLCEVQKNDSIMAINFLNLANSSIDISKSPYYLEGIAEKKALLNWEQILSNSR